MVAVLIPGSIIIVVRLKKKRNLPLVLEAMQEHEGMQIPWLANKILVFEGASAS